MRTARSFCLIGLVAEGGLLAVLSSYAGLSFAGWSVGLVVVSAVVGLFARALLKRAAAGPQPADWVTLARAVLTAGAAGIVAGAFLGHATAGAIVVLSAVALVLDGFDGYVARRTRTASELGARFDMEVDAVLILVLSIDVSRAFGAWVLAIGLARYGLLGAERVVPWLRRWVPVRWWRKAVAAFQGIVLTVAAAGVVPYGVTAGLIVVALVLLAESFGRDIGWLFRRRATPTIVGVPPNRPRQMVPHG